jgi:hypothetical protein
MSSKSNLTARVERTVEIIGDILHPYPPEDFTLTQREKKYEVVSKSFRTGRLVRELQMV